MGLASCIIPEVGRPNYLIEKGTMEIGVGHHGLPGSDTCKLKTANATAEIMLSEIMKDMPLVRGDRVALMSGLGNTMLSELHILFSRVYDVLQAEGIMTHPRVCRKLLHLAGHDGRDTDPHEGGRRSSAASGLPGYAASEPFYPLIP